MRHHICTTPHRTTTHLTHALHKAALPENQEYKEQMAEAFDFLEVQSSKHNHYDACVLLTALYIVQLENGV